MRMNVPGEWVYNAHSIVNAKYVAIAGYEISSDE